MFKIKQLSRQLLIPAAILAGVVTAAAQETVPVVSPENFAKTAAISSLYEIEAAKIATSKAHDNRVRAFANQMIADHTKAQKELQSTAADIALPSAVDPPHQKLLDSLQSASGDRFDRLYVDQQISAHSDAVSLFTGFSTSGPNGSLKGLAAHQLPILQSHQDMIGQIKSSFQ